MELIAIELTFATPQINKADINDYKHVDFHQ